ncbi:MAG: hypothetical protein ACI4EM_06420 [Hominisplanchenecus sp.]
MTEQEALEKARAQIKAERAAYMREWRKRNPGREKENREKKRAREIMEEVQANGK